MADSRAGSSPAFGTTIILWNKGLAIIAVPFFVGQMLVNRKIAPYPFTKPGDLNPCRRRERLMTGVQISGPKAFKPCVLGYLSKFPWVVLGTFIYPFIPFSTENVPDLSPG